MGRRFDGIGRRASLVGIWVTATVLAAVVAWSAVARLGPVESVTSAPLSSSQIKRDLAQQSSTTTKAPTQPGHTTTITARPPGRSTTTSPPATPPATAPGTAPASSTTPGSPSGPPPPPRRFRSWTLNGGSVGASCRGSIVSLGYAIPKDGWSMQNEQGASELKVRFTRGESESTLTVVCRAGVPTGKTEDGGYGGGDGGGEGGDH